MKANHGKCHLKLNGKAIHFKVWLIEIYETLCGIWHYLYNLQNVKNTHGRLLLSVNLEASGAV